MIPSLYEQYASRIQASQFLPNFWVSELYWHRAGWQAKVDPGEDNWMYVVDSDGEIMLPALDVLGNPHPTLPYWASLIGMGGKSTLDANYLYHRVDREQLTGGRWRDLRKSLARVERELGGQLVLRPIGAGDLPQVTDMILSWAGDRELYDPEILTQYLLQGPHLAVVRPNRQDVLGVVAWDSNYRFINFRYCVVDKSGPVGLDEYARYLFWQTIPNDTFINDGGGLDREGLHRYKQKLNPIHKFTVWSKS